MQNFKDAIKIIICVFLALPQAQGRISVSPTQALELFPIDRERISKEFYTFAHDDSPGSLQHLIRRNLSEAKQKIAERKKSENIAKTNRWGSGGLSSVTQNILMMYIQTLVIASAETMKANQNSDEPKLKMTEIMSAMTAQMVDGFELYLGTMGSTVLGGAGMVGIDKSMQATSWLTQALSEAKVVAQTAATQAGGSVFRDLIRSGGISFITFVGWEASVQLFEEAKRSIAQENRIEGFILDEIRVSDILKREGTDLQKALFGKIMVRMLEIMTFEREELAQQWLFNTWRFKIMTGEFVTNVAVFSAAAYATGVVAAAGYGMGAGMVGGPAGVALGLIIGTAFGLTVMTVAGVVTYLIPQSWKDNITLELQALRYASNRTQHQEWRIKQHLHYQPDNISSEYVRANIKKWAESREAAATATFDSIAKHLGMQSYMKNSAKPTKELSETVLKEVEWRLRRLIEDYKSDADKMADFYVQMQTKQANSGMTTPDESYTREVLMCETARLNRLAHKYELLYKALMAGPMNQLKTVMNRILPDNMQSRLENEETLFKLKSAGELYLIGMNSIGASERQLFEELPCAQ